MTKQSTYTSDFKDIAPILKRVFEQITDQLDNLRPSVTITVTEPEDIAERARTFLYALGYDAIWEDEQLIVEYVRPSVNFVERLYPTYATDIEHFATQYPKGLITAQQAHDEKHAHFIKVFTQGLIDEGIISAEELKRIKQQGE